MDGDYGVENLSGPASGSTMKPEVLLEARAFDTQFAESYKEAMSRQLFQ